jgi:predicted DNA-binding transcriptional regulator AlpA
MTELRADLLAVSVEAPTLIDARDLATLMRCDISTVHRMASRGTFPKPLRDTGLRGYRWFTRDYVEWLKAHAPDG